MVSTSPMFSRPYYTSTMGQPQKLPLWRNRRRSQNSPIFARPKKDFFWNFPSHRQRRASRLCTFILAILFSIVIFATASQVIFLFRVDEKILVSMPDMRLQQWFGFEKVYGYQDGIRSLLPFNVVPASSYSNPTRDSEHPAATKLNYESKPACKTCLAQRLGMRGVTGAGKGRKCLRWVHIGTNRDIVY